MLAEWGSVNNNAPWGHGARQRPRYEKILVIALVLALVSMLAGCTLMKVSISEEIQLSPSA